MISFSSVADRRLRQLRLHTDLLSEWLRGEGNAVRFTNAPPDLRVVGISLATTGPGEWHLVIWSATFDIVADPYDIPFADFEYMP
jgi:hypothetical protein